jgi:hypothetical protein
LFARLRRRGGSVRIRALLRCSGHATDELCAVLNELRERNWIGARWCRPRGDLPERLREVGRVTATRQGRLHAPRIWLVER